MSKIELKKYDLENEFDVNELVEIIRKYYTTSPWPVTHEKIRGKGVVYYRAFNDGDFIGITGHSQKTPTLTETVKTTVFDEYRGKGLGKHLSQAIEDECRRIGIKKVMTTIFHFNHQMIKIKLSQGYTIEGYHPDHEAIGFHEYSLGKLL